MIHKEKKRGLWGLLALVLCCALAGCGDTGAGSESSSEETLQVTETETTTTEQTTTTEETTTTTQTTTEATTTTTTTTAPPPAASTISDRMVFYDEPSDSFVIRFILRDAQNQPVTASGTADVEITDSSEHAAVYNRMIPFNEGDYTDYTVKGNPVHGCQLKIARADVSPAEATTGTLALTVAGTGYSFGPENYNIDHLREKPGTIHLPKLPANFTDSRYYSHTSYFTASDLTCEKETYYDGSMTVTLKLVITLNSKTGEENVADTVALGYRLVDSKGVFVDSGTIYSSTIRPGEKSTADTLIVGLDPEETYTLTFENST